MFSASPLQAVAIVTGAGRGIGRATALELATRGYRVVLVSRTLYELEAVASELSKLGRASPLVVPCDVSDEAQVVQLFERVDQEGSRLACLINNVGAFSRSAIVETTGEDWDRLFAVNVRSAFLCSREAFRRFAASGGGCIVNVASKGGLRGTPKFANTSGYVATKFALIGLTEALAAEGRPLRIRVNGVAPGAVDTPMLRTFEPLGRTDLKPEHVAQTVAHLCDEDAAGHLTGTMVEMFSNFERVGRGE